MIGRIGDLIRNSLGDILKARGISPYRLWKEAEINQRTAYRLFEPDYVPREDIMHKLGELYGIQPGAYLAYLPGNADKKLELGIDKSK